MSILVGGIELKKSRSYKFYDRLKAHGLDYPVLDHVQFYRKATTNQFVLISHSYGFHLESFTNYEDMLDEGIQIIINPGMNPEDRYSNETVPIMFTENNRHSIIE